MRFTHNKIVVLNDMFPTHWSDALLVFVLNSVRVIVDVVLL